MAENITAAQLVEDLHAVIRDAEALLGATAAQTGEQVEEARLRAEESVRAAKARLADIEQELRARAGALAADAEQWVRSNPWQGVAVAAGVGLALGLLLNRR